jgi:hypothetical protein
MPVVSVECDREFQCRASSLETKRGA